MFLDDSVEQKRGNKIAWIVGLAIVIALILLMIYLK